MSALVVRDLDQAWGTLSDLSEAKEEILNLEIEVVNKHLRIRDRVRTLMFSDTIVMFTLGEDAEDLYAILILCTELFSRSLKRCVPLRVGIAHGPFRVNLPLQMFAGPSLVSAYWLGEQSQWLGIVVDSTVAARSRALPLEVIPGQPVIDQWNVPLRSGQCQSLDVVNWPAVCQNCFTAPKPFTPEQFYQGFAPMFGRYADLPVDVQRKYENTVEYINNRL